MPDRDLILAVQKAIALVRQLPSEKLTITEINVVETLETALAKHAAEPVLERLRPYVSADDVDITDVAELARLIADRAADDTAPAMRA